MGTRVSGFPLIGFVVVLATLFIAQPAAAQATRGTIQGTVKDASGATLPGATVEVRNVATGVALTLVTNGEGRYTAPDLALGEYEVRSSVAGFQAVLRTGLTLRVGSQLVIDFELPVGAVQETVTVAGAAPTIDTVSSAIGTVIEQKQLADLPLNGRNISQLISLAPGAVEIPFGTTGGNAFFGKQSNFTVSGARADGQAFLFDNTNIQGFWNRGPGSGVFGTWLGVEAAAEFQTLTNTYSAQFGGNGSAINVITKSGANAVHGSAFEFYRNGKMDATDFFQQVAHGGVGKQPFEKHQFGASIGGPLKQNKVFYFLNYEGIQQDLTETRIATVPDLAARGGVIDGVSIPVSPAIAALFPLLPAPTIIVGGGFGQVPQTATSSGHEHYVLGRVDYNFSNANSLFARYASDSATINNPFEGSNIPLWGSSQRSNNQYLVAEQRTVVSSALINQVRFGYVRLREDAKTTGPTVGSVLDFFPGENRQNGSLVIGAFGGPSIGASLGMPVDTGVDRYTVGNDVYWNMGAHSIKLGGSIERTRTLMNAPAFASGVWFFPDMRTLLAGTASVFLGAAPHRDNAERTTRETIFAGYIQDDWRLGSRLTVNLGLRYNPALNPEIENPGPGGPATTLKNAPLEGFTGTDRVFASNPTLRNWEPRVGFAYTPFSDNKTSIRGGVGVFHAMINPRIILPYYVNNPPYDFVTLVNLGVFGVPGAPVCAAYPNPFPSPCGTPLSVGYGIDYNAKTTPYMVQWNVNVQREILAGTSATVGYVASRGVNLLRQQDANPVRLSPDGSWGTNTPFGFFPNPRMNAQFGALFINEPNAWSQYHSLQASLNRRFSSGVQSQLSYTLSKCTDLSSGVYGDGGTAGTNPYDDEYDKGPCFFDRRHALSASGIWALPFHGNRLADGWQVTGILRATSGRPFSPSVGVNRSGLQSSLTLERPNLAPGKSLDDAITGDYQRWFDPTVFTLPAPGTLGTVGRHSLRAPAFFTLDLSVTKDLDFSNFGMQFRLETFNITNHVNFGLPVAEVTLPTAGQITTTASPPRQVQLAVKLRF